MDRFLGGRRVSCICSGTARARLLDTLASTAFNGLHRLVVSHRLCCARLHIRAQGVVRCPTPCRGVGCCAVRAEVSVRAPRSPPTLGQDFFSSAQHRISLTGAAAPESVPQKGFADPWRLEQLHLCMGPPCLHCGCRQICTLCVFVSLCVCVFVSLCVCGKPHMPIVHIRRGITSIVRLERFGVSVGQLSLGRLSRLKCRMRQHRLKTLAVGSSANERRLSSSAGVPTASLGRPGRSPLTLRRAMSPPAKVPDERCWAALARIIDSLSGQVQALHNAGGFCRQIQEAVTSLAQWRGKS